MPRRRARSARRSRPPSTRSSSGRSTQIRRAASPTASLWPPRSNRSSRAPIRRARRSASRPPRWPRAPPRWLQPAAAAVPVGDASLRPPSAAGPVRPAGVSPVRRASPVIAGPLLVLVLVAVVVVGGLFVASLPGRADSGAVALATTTPKPTRTPTPTPRPTAVPTVKPTKAPTPVPKRRPRSPRPARRATCAIRSSVSPAAWRRGPTPRHGSSRPSCSSSATAGRHRCGSRT